MQIEHTMTARNAAGLVIDQRELLVTIDNISLEWWISAIEDDQGNVIDGPLLLAYTGYLEADPRFREKVEAEGFRRMEAQYQNQKYDAKYRSDV